MHALHDGFVQACIFQIHVFCRRRNLAVVVPRDEACAAIIKTVAFKRLSFRRRDVRHAHVAAVAKEQRERIKLRIEHQMIAREAADTKTMRAHVRRHFAQALKRMLGKAKEAQRLAVCAVGVQSACAVCACRRRL